MSKTLNVNCIYLIDIVRALIHGAEIPAAPAGVDHAKLAAIAEKQGLTCMLYHGLYKRGFEGVEEAVKQQLKKNHMVYVQHAVMQEMEFYKISSAFDTAGIDYMPLKGWYTRELYPEAVLRYMGDVDVLIRAEDSKRVFDVMQKLGYSCDAFMKNDDDKYRKSGLAFEMHRMLDAEGLADASIYLEPFSLAERTEGRCYRMRRCDAYLYTVVHGMKHFMYGGTGLRTLLDTYLYLEDAEVVNGRQYIDGAAERMGIAKYLHRMERLAVTAFGSGEPVAEGEIDGESAELIEFMIKSGASGNSSTLDASLMDKSGKGGKGGSKASMLLRMLFPPYKIMRRRNPVLKKAPFLLPFMYVYRWFQLLFTDRGHIRDRFERYSAIEDGALDELRHIHDIAGLE